MASRVHITPYPGEFSSEFVFSPGAPYRDWEAKFVLPASKKLYIDRRGVTGGLEKTVGGQSHYTFKYRREKTRPPESGAVGLMHYADYLFVSTMPDMLALGRVAKKFFEPHVAVNDEIRTLAQRLTQGAADDRAKAKALYEWVAQNIRYVSIALGDGRLVPRPASNVLHNRYGDCKDHVVLLESLLTAVGIRSSPAMINLGPDHIFSKIGAHYPINHVITYVPSLDLYLDSTDPFAPFGTLPSGDLDKPVVLTALDRIGHTPKMKSEENTSRVQVSMNIGPDGTIAGTSNAQMTGYFENNSRLKRFSNQSRPEEVEVKDLLFRFNETGTGSMRYTDPTDITKPYWVNAKFTLEPLANMPGRGGLAIPVGLAPGLIASAASNKPEPESDIPSRCSSRVVEEKYDLNFPVNVSIEDIPKGARFERGDIFYESRFVQDGRKVSLHRTLRVQRASKICGVKESRDWLAFYKVLQRDLRSQIIYR
ncbi:MAG: transglutaminase-like domain-containing protein [Burkholderiaceae bacterium]